MSINRADATQRTMSWLCRTSAAADPVGDEAYWQHRLQSLRYVELAADHPRLPIRTRVVDRRWLLLAPSLSSALRLGANGAEPKVLGALYTLLYRYTGEYDVTVGLYDSAAAEVTARTDDQEAPAPRSLLRVDLSSDPTVTELLLMLQSQLAADEAHRMPPLQRLVELIQPQLDLSRNPLFAVSYCHWSETSDALGLGATSTQGSVIHHDLQFFVQREVEAWSIGCDFNCDVFDAVTIERLLGHLGNLLHAISADPARRLSALPLLDDLEHQWLLSGYNPLRTAYPGEALPELIAAQAARTPTALAVSGSGERLSYREFHAAASRLANWLCQQGIGPGDRVGVCLQRTPQLPVALLAVLMTGAAYVPLDPAYPLERLARILEDASPRALLIETPLLGRLPASQALIVALDVVAGDISQQPAVAPSVAIDPNSVAYVIFTSGSTGRPKGVQVPHRAMTNLFWSMLSSPGLIASDRLLAVSTVSFDIALVELFLPLIVGAQVFIAKEEEARDGHALGQLLANNHITVLQGTPATWQLLLAGGWQGGLIGGSAAAGRLKMLCGGEALSRSLADQLLQRGGELWNVYGPTETTVYSAVLRVQAGTGPVPIGPPIANTQLYVVDSRGELLPLGVPGELVIGGDGVALGYLHQAALTDERFVEDRLRAEPGARLYRTGDRVRLLASGEIEYLGRGDQQIKLRGFRIELGEIETVLAAHPEVDEAIAILLSDAGQEPRLVAYVLPLNTPAAPGLVGRLRERLCEALPIYMCPSSIAVLQRWPRLPNGKVDRSALPQSALQPLSDQATQAPTNPTEQRLAHIWREDLHVSAQSIHDNFFEIGGHSLLAARLLGRIEVEFGQRLSLATLFRHPSIAEQARVLLEGDVQAFDFQQVLQLQPAGGRAPLIAVNNTGIFYALSKHLGTDQPFTCLQLFDPALPPDTRPDTLEDIARRYVQLILQVQPQGPYALLGWCVAGTLAFEVACQLRAAGMTVSQLVLFDAEAPGYWQRLPWLRRLLAETSQRWQWIRADWVRSKRARQRWSVFLENRATVQKLRRWAKPGSRPSRQAAVRSSTSAHQHDQWLLQHLEYCARRYQPRQYEGSMLLFTSSQQPGGRFIDAELGWGEFVAGGVEVQVIAGDHFNIFREPGVAEMAHHISARLNSP